jgi:precorrin-2 dehydrogenase/sirohydrochlorin ferrochelatase
MLDIRGRSAIVIGGDRVAAEKATNLSAAGALVTVINPEFCAELQALQSQQAVMLRPKTYETGDLAGAFVVVAATTSNHEMSKQIWQEAQERGQLINIVDVPALCNFILPSILRRGQLTISVSTEGASPALAKRIRQQLEGTFPPAYGTYLQLAGLVRTYSKQHGLSYEERDAFFGDFFSAGILEALAEGDEMGAFASTVRLLRAYHLDISITTLVHDMEAATNNGHIHKHA